MDSFNQIKKILWKNWKLLNLGVSSNSKSSDIRFSKKLW